MKTELCTRRSLALAMFALGLPGPLGAGTLDDAAVAAELSRMGCQVEIRLVDGTPSVERVQIYQDLSDDLFAQLKKLHRVSALDLRLPAENSGSAALRGLVSLSALRELTLSGPEITDKFTQSIASMTNLESLNLHCVSITEAGVVQLATLKALKHLELSDLKTITKDGLRAIATLRNLEEVSVAGNCEKGALLALKSLEKLATVSVGGIHLDNQLAELKTLPSVRRVKISSATITPATADALLAMRNLECLELVCCDIQPEAARQLQLLHLKQFDYYGADSSAPYELLKALGRDVWDMHIRSNN